MFISSLFPATGFLFILHRCSLFRVKFFGWNNEKPVSLLLLLSLSSLLLFPQKNYVTFNAPRKNEIRAFVAMFPVWWRFDLFSLSLTLFCEYASDSPLARSLWQKPLTTSVYERTRKKDQESFSSCAWCLQSLLTFYGTRKGNIVWVRRHFKGIAQAHSTAFPRFLQVASLHEKRKKNQRLRSNESSALWKFNMRIYSNTKLEFLKLDSDSKFPGIS